MKDPLQQAVQGSGQPGAAAGYQLGQRLQAVDVRHVMREVREKIHPTRQKKAEVARLLALPAPEAVHMPNLDLVSTWVGEIRHSAAKVGEMPPVPPTARGRAGSLLVQFVRRALFWYTPQIQAFHVRVSRAFDEHLHATATLMNTVRQLSLEVAALRQALDQQRAAGNGEAPEGTAAWLAMAETSRNTLRALQLESALRRGTAPAGEMPEDGEPERMWQRYLPALREAAGRTGGAPALDLSCGGGEFLRLLQEQGWRAYGIDREASAVESCAAEGFASYQAEPLEHLRELVDDSLGAIAGRGFLQTVPLADLPALLSEARRVLKPGGVLILEGGHGSGGLLPAPQLAWTIEAGGFRNAEVHYDNPAPVRAALRKDWQGVLPALCEEPRVHAVIARK